MQADDAAERDGEGAGSDDDGEELMPRVKRPKTVAELHAAFTDGLLHDRGQPTTHHPAMGRGWFFGGLDKVGVRWLRLRNRGGWALQAEAMPPTGQAALWFGEVEKEAPVSAVHVARQIARLCGEDSQVSVPDRSLADAVGVKDKAGRGTAYMERGRQWLEENGWVRREVEGKKRGATTTYFLTVPTC